MEEVTEGLASATITPPTANHGHTDYGAVHAVEHPPKSSASPLIIYEQGNAARVARKLTDEIIRKNPMEMLDARKILKENEIDIESDPTPVVMERKRGDKPQGPDRVPERGKGLKQFSTSAGGKGHMVGTGFPGGAFPEGGGDKRGIGRGPPMSFTTGGGQAGRNKKFETRPGGGVRTVSDDADLEAVAPLVVSDKAWKPRLTNNQTEDEISAKVKQARLILNKLTVDKFDTLYEQIRTIDIHNYEVLNGIVAEVFEKAVLQPSFSSMYAELCKRLSEEVKEEFVIIMEDPENPENNKNETLSFKRILLKACQSEFERGSLNEDEQYVKEHIKKKTEEEISPEDIKEAMTKAKRRMLGNLRFIGELYVKDLINETVIRTRCIEELLKKVEKTKDEEDIESLCKLFTTVGKNLEGRSGKSKKAKNDEYFKRLEDIGKDKALPSRARFLIQDALDLRANQWVPRRKEATAKSIAEIHEDAKKEEIAKAQNADLNRTGSGRMQTGRGDYRKQSTGFGGATSVSRMTQHMVNTPASGASGASGGGPSHLENIIQKRKLDGAAAAPGAGGNLPAVRLGPGGGGGFSSSWGQPSLGGGRGSGLGMGSTGGAGKPGTDGKSNGEVKTTNAFSVLQSESHEDGHTASSAQSSHAEPGASPIAESAAVTAPAAPAKKELDRDECERRTKSIVKEYISDENMSEAKFSLSELTDSNLTMFVEFALLFAADAKQSEREKIGQLLLGAIPPITTKNLTGSFSVVVSEIDALAIDFPYALDAIPKYTAQLFASGAFGSPDENKWETDWLKSSISEVYAKLAAAKYIVFMLVELRNIMGEEKGTDYCNKLYKALGLDVFEMVSKVESEKKQLETLVEQKNASSLLSSV